ncbi:MAG: exosortase/archaeosortase family protein, partial [Gammaproteobacteria bacterium]|nr:exosortase/archaeosortase family protein [Gammaproteobacteria bacterium]
MSSIDPVESTQPEAAEPLARSADGIILWVLFLASLILLGFIFQSGLAEMVKDWQLDEYSHGYMIPMVAAFIFWQKQ